MLFFSILCHFLPLLRLELGLILTFLRIIRAGSNSLRQVFTASDSLRFPNNLASLGKLQFISCFFVIFYSSLFSRSSLSRLRLFLFPSFPFLCSVYLSLSLFMIFFLILPCFGLFGLSCLFSSLTGFFCLFHSFNRYMSVYVLSVEFCLEGSTTMCEKRIRTRDEVSAGPFITAKCKG